MELEMLDSGLNYQELTPLLRCSLAGTNLSPSVPSAPPSPVLLENQTSVPFRSWLPGAVLSHGLFVHQLGFPGSLI